MAFLRTYCYRDATHGFIDGQSSGVSPQSLDQLLGLCGVLLTAVQGAQDMQGSLKQEMCYEWTSAESAGPEWLSGPGPQAAWLELAKVSRGLAQQPCVSVLLLRVVLSVFVLSMCVCACAWHPCCF